MMEAVTSNILTGQELVKLEMDPISIVASVLRTFVASGEEVQNPVVGFNAEFSASSNGGGHLSPDSRLGRIDVGQFNSEKEYAQKAGDLWGVNFFLSAEDLFLQLVHRDRLFDGRFVWREGSEGQLLRAGRPPRRRQFHSWHPYTYDIIRSLRYLRPCEESPFMEGGISASAIDDRPCRLLREYLREFESDAFVSAESRYLLNPLVVMRILDNRQEGICAVTEDRESAIRELEGLSLRLWHMCTSIGPRTLLVRLMLQEDSGLRDLRTLIRYRRYCLHVDEQC